MNPGPLACEASMLPLHHRANEEKKRERAITKRKREGAAKKRKRKGTVEKKRMENKVQKTEIRLYDCALLPGALE